MVPEGKCDGNFTKDRRSMVREMCRLQLKDRERSAGLMFMLGLNEAMDHLAMTNSVR